MYKNNWFSNKIYGKIFTKKLNKKFAVKINDSDKQNKRRLIRYIEVAGNGANNAQAKRVDNFDYLILGTTWPKEELRKRIYRRLVERLEKEDMIKEVEDLHKIHKVSWKRLKSFGLEYKFISKYLQKELTYDEMVERLNIASRQFAKRQMTWLRRWEKQGAKINWVKNGREAEKLVKNFLK